MPCSLPVRAGRAYFAFRFERSSEVSDSGASPSSSSRATGAAAGRLAAGGLLAAGEGEGVALA
ncbi:MAG: hypothetical protein V4773_17580, partial [Verrucomicrobiota bacterium]